MIKALFFLLSASSVFAMGGPAQGQDTGSSMISMLVMFGAVILIMYFLMIRPQQKRQKEHQNMLNSIKKGDKIITSAGIHGTVKDIDGNQMHIQIADNVVIKIDKAAVVNKEA